MPTQKPIHRWEKDLRVVRFGSNITMLDFMQAEETAIQTVTGIVPPHIKHDLQQHLSNFFRSVFDRFVEQEKHYYQLQTLQKSMKQWQLEYSDKVGELNGVLERERKLELQILYMQKQLKLRNTELTTHRENYYKSLLLIREIIVHHGLHPDLLVDDYVDPGSIASSKAMRAQFAAQFHRLNAHFLAQAKKWEYNLLECINKHDEKVERLSNLVNTLYTAVSRQRYKSKRDIAVLQAQEKKSKEVIARLKSIIKSRNETSKIVAQDRERARMLSSSQTLGSNNAESGGSNTNISALGGGNSGVSMGGSDNSLFDRDVDLLFEGYDRQNPSSRVSYWHAWRKRLTNTINPIPQPEIIEKLRAKNPPASIVQLIDFREMQARELSKFTRYLPIHMDDYEDEKEERERKKQEQQQQQRQGEVFHQGDDTSKDKSGMSATGIQDSRYPSTAKERIMALVDEKACRTRKMTRSLSIGRFQFEFRRFENNVKRGITDSDGQLNTCAAATGDASASATSKTGKRRMSCVSAYVIKHYHNQQRAQHQHLGSAEFDATNNLSSHSEIRRKSAFARTHTQSISSRIAMKEKEDLQQLQVKYGVFLSLRLHNTREGAARGQLNTQTRLARQSSSLSASRARQSFTSSSSMMKTALKTHASNSRSRRISVMGRTRALAFFAASASASVAKTSAMNVVAEVEAKASSPLDQSKPFALRSKTTDEDSALIIAVERANLSAKKVKEQVYVIAAKDSAIDKLKKRVASLKQMVVKMRKMQRVAKKVSGNGIKKDRKKEKERRHEGRDAKTQEESIENTHTTAGADVSRVAKAHDVSSITATGEYGEVVAEEGAGVDTNIDHGTGTNKDSDSDSGSDSDSDSGSDNDNDSYSEDELELARSHAASSRTETNALHALWRNHPRTLIDSSNLSAEVHPLSPTRSLSSGEHGNRASRSHSQRKTKAGGRGDTQTNTEAGSVEIVDNENIFGQLVSRSVGVGADAHTYGFDSRYNHQHHAKLRKYVKEVTRQTNTWFTLLKQTEIQAIHDAVDETCDHSQGSDSDRDSVHERHSGDGQREGVTAVTAEHVTRVIHIYTDHITDKIRDLEKSMINRLCASQQAFVRYEEKPLIHSACKGWGVAMTAQDREGRRMKYRNNSTNGGSNTGGGGNGDRKEKGNENENDSGNGAYESDGSPRDQSQKRNASNGNNGPYHRNTALDAFMTDAASEQREAKMRKKMEKKKTKISASRVDGNIDVGDHSTGDEEAEASEDDSICALNGFQENINAGEIEHGQQRVARGDEEDKGGPVTRTQTRESTNKRAKGIDALLSGSGAFGEGLGTTAAGGENLSTTVAELPGLAEIFNRMHARASLPLAHNQRVREEFAKERKKRVEEILRGIEQLESQTSLPSSMSSAAESRTVSPFPSAASAAGFQLSFPSPSPDPSDISPQLQGASARSPRATQPHSTSIGTTTSHRSGSRNRSRNRGKHRHSNSNSNSNSNSSSNSDDMSSANHMYGGEHVQSLPQARRSSKMESRDRHADYIDQLFPIVGEEVGEYERARIVYKVDGNQATTQRYVASRSKNKQQTRQRKQCSHSSSQSSSRPASRSRSRNSGVSLLSHPHGHKLAHASLRGPTPPPIPVSTSSSRSSSRHQHHPFNSPHDDENGHLTQWSAGDEDVNTNTNGNSSSRSDSRNKNHKHNTNSNLSNTGSPHRGGSADLMEMMNLNSKYNMKNSDDVISNKTMVPRPPSAKQKKRKGRSKSKRMTY